MSNVPNVNFNKIPNKGVQFNQKQYYEDNFEKINTELIPSVNTQLNDIGQDVLDLDLAKAPKTDVGLLSDLLTATKTSIVNAINELFDTKANKAVTAYEPTLQSGFSGGSAGVEKVRVYKDSFGFVHIEGRVEGSRLFGASNPVFTLPLEFRPKYVQTQTICNNAISGGFTKFRIFASTGVAFFENDPQTWTGINIHYYAGF